MRRFMFMSKVAIGLIAAALLLQPYGNLSAQQEPNQTTTIRDSYAGEAITVADTAIGFTSSLITPTCTDCPINTLRATLATCVLETAAIRVRSDGTDPTADIGLLISAGQSFSIYGYDNILAFRAIRDTGSSGALFCEYSRIP